MIENLKDNILVEKYRPVKFADIVLEAETKKLFEDILSKAKASNPIGLPHLILEGAVGSGKTTISKVLCLELNLEHMFFNVGSDLNMDALRNQITNFAQTMSVYDFDENGKEIHKKKVVILDEIDGLSKQSNVAKTLKSFIEMYSNNCTFIFTCNNFDIVTNDLDVKSALKSRCQYFNFSIKDKPKYQAMIYKRLEFICNTEGFKFSKQNLVDIIKHFGTDMRSMINFIDQHYSELEKPNLVFLLTRGKIEELFKNIRDKDFVSIRKFLNETDINFGSLFYEVYTYAKEFVDKPEESLPFVILITEQYMDRYTRSINPEITLVAYLIELAYKVSWKKS